MESTTKMQQGRQETEGYKSTSNRNATQNTKLDVSHQAGVVTTREGNRTQHEKNVTD